MDLAAYEASVIDWANLRTFAARVSAARVAVGLGDEAVLATRSQRKKLPGGAVEASTTTLVLASRGRMVSRLHSWTDLAVAPWCIDDGTSEHDFFPTDVTFFDYRHGTTNFGGLVTVGDLVGSPLFEAKGIGLSLALKRLLPVSEGSGRGSGCG